jgi:hypothetical protein
VPQLPEGQTLSPSRSCVSSYPTTCREGLLWVWPDASPAALIESADEAAWPGVAPEIDQMGEGAWSRASAKHRWYARWVVCVGRGATVVAASLDGVAASRPGVVCPACSHRHSCCRAARPAPSTPSLPVLISPRADTCHTSPALSSVTSATITERTKPCLPLAPACPQGPAVPLASCQGECLQRLQP